MTQLSPAARALQEKKAILKMFNNLNERLGTLEAAMVEIVGVLESMKPEDKAPG